MVVCEWRIRTYDEEVDEQHAYCDYPNYFSLKIHHGGKYSDSLHRKYKDGTFNFFDEVDVDLFSIVDLNDMLAILGYKNISDILLNNICEVFNRRLVKGRDAPIITCLEYVREYLMKRIVKVQQLIEKAKGPLTPAAAAALFQVINDEATLCKVIWNGDHQYQVTGPFNDQCVVDVKEKTCSCRKWDLTGMPCKHAVAALWDRAGNTSDVGPPETWVHACYWLATWKRVYSYKINPLNGKDYWKKHPCPNTLIPPKVLPQIGRPPKKRKKSANELSSQQMTKGGKLARLGKTVTCDKCKTPGHNRRSCKSGVGGSQAPAARVPNAARGPQRKAASSQASLATPATPKVSQRPKAPRVSQSGVGGSQASPATPRVSQRPKAPQRKLAFHYF